MNGYMPKMKQCKRCWPNPIPFIKQYLKEGKSVEFTNINMIKYNLGPKIGFYFAFVSFITSWLFILVVIGFVTSKLVNNLIILGVNYIISWAFSEAVLLIYLACLLLWLTVVYKRWMRKASEIALKWKQDLDSNTIYSKF
jgi:hypothetical protein